MFENMPDPFMIIALLALLTLAPFIAVMVTSYVKLVVVLSLVRNALGVQQVPPNMVINGLAIILTLFIMAPVGQQIYDQVQGKNYSFNDVDGLIQGAEKAKEPIRAFLLKHSRPRIRAFFMKSAQILWPKESSASLRDDDLMILAPSFTISELTMAFEIGFLLYLPFIAIDLIISNILLAMGMMMVSPMTVSLPFKLLLFVLLEGWTKIVQGLIMTYA